MYAHTLLHGAANTKALPPKAKIQVIASLDILDFFLYDHFTVNRDFWFLSILYMLKRKS